MKVITFILVIWVSIVMAQKKRKKGDHFNILSLDGGGIRGLIPAQAIKNIETYAYKYC